MPRTRLGCIVQGPRLHKPEPHRYAAAFGPAAAILRWTKLADADIASSLAEALLRSGSLNLTNTGYATEKDLACLGPAAPFSDLIFLVGFTALAIAAFVTLRDLDAPAMSTIGGPFTLTGSNGKTVTQRDFAGEPTLVFFGYTHCPDVCPATLFEMSEVWARSGRTRRRPPVHHGRPGARHPGGPEGLPVEFRPRIVGLSGSRGAIDALKAFRVYARKVPAKDGDYTMDHTALVYLMDKQGGSCGPSASSARPT